MEAPPINEAIKEEIEINTKDNKINISIQIINKEIIECYEKLYEYQDLIQKYNILSMYDSNEKIIETFKKLISLKKYTTKKEENKITLKFIIFIIDTEQYINLDIPKTQIDKDSQIKHLLKIINQLKEENQMLKKKLFIKDISVYNQNLNFENFTSGSK